MNQYFQPFIVKQADLETLASLVRIGHTVPLGSGLTRVMFYDSAVAVHVLDSNHLWWGYDK